MHLLVLWGNRKPIIVYADVYWSICMQCYLVPSSFIKYWNWSFILFFCCERPLIRSLYRFYSSLDQLEIHRLTHELRRNESRQMMFLYSQVTRWNYLGLIWISNGIVGKSREQFYLMNKIIVKQKKIRQTMLLRETRRNRLDLKSESVVRRSWIGTASSGK